MIVSLVGFVPKDIIREAQVAFLFKQIITWVTGLAVVELGLIEYPVRLFPNTNKTSFSFEYFIYPSICAIFNVNYPTEKSIFGQFSYYFYYCTTLTLIKVIVEGLDLVYNLAFTFYNLLYYTKMFSDNVFALAEMASKSTMHPL